LADIDRLKDVQKQGIHKILQMAGFEKREFEWSVVPTQTSPLERRALVGVEKITHKASGYYFMFDFERNGGRISRFSPGAELTEEVHRARDWATQAQHVIDWATCMKEEMETKDPWSILEEEEKLLESGDQGPFAPQEQQEIRALLDDWVGEMRRRDDLADQRFERIEKDVQDLKDALEVLKRQAWMKLALGTVVSWGLKTETAQSIFGWLMEGVQKIIETPPPSLPPIA
jgi:hypothetical protein